LGWGTEGAEAVGLYFDAAREGVFAQAVKVLKAGRGKVGQVFVAHFHTFGAQRFDCLEQAQPNVGLLVQSA